MKNKGTREKIKDVKVMPNFSFITVPLDEAEIIIKIFNKNTTKIANLWLKLLILISLEMDQIKKVEQS